MIKGAVVMLVGVIFGYSLGMVKDNSETYVFENSSN